MLPTVDEHPICEEVALQLAALSYKHWDIPRHLWAMWLAETVACGAGAIKDHSSS